MDLDLAKSYGPTFWLRDSNGVRHVGHGPLTRTMNEARAAAVQSAGAKVAASRMACAQMTPREQAEAAWTPTCRSTVDELEDRIRVERGLPHGGPPRPPSGG